MTRFPKLGMKPTVYDARTLYLAKYLRLPDITIPTMVDWYSAVPRWPPLGNLKIGDCTVVAAAHTVQAWTKHSKAHMQIPTLKACIEAYKKVSNYPRCDDGAALLDVMRLWKNTGIGQHRIKAFLGVDYKNTTVQKAGIYLFGSVIVGVLLPLAAQQFVDNDVTWDAPAGPLTGEWAGGSWGGHAIPILGWESSGNWQFASWDRMYAMTPRFFTAYCIEAYVGWSVRDWTTNGEAPNGFDVDALDRDLRKLRTA